jgi:hypothetical protein
MRRTLTDKGVVALRPRTKRYTKPDPGCLGHYIRVMPSGAKSYTVVARNPFGKQVWVTLGNTTNHTIAAAREPNVTIKRIQQGLPAVEPPAPAADSYTTVAQNWLKRYVQTKQLRSSAQIERILGK